MAIAENPRERTARDFLAEYNLTMEQLNRLVEVMAREPMPEVVPEPPPDLTRGLTEEQILGLAERGIII